jgi:hypothetical protein
VKIHQSRDGYHRRDVPMSCPEIKATSEIAHANILITYQVYEYHITLISLSSTIMPASPGDPSEWENFSWTPAEEPPPSLSSSSSESSVSNIVSVYEDGGVGRISYHEWLRRHPGLLRRPQYSLLRMIVLRVWGLLADVKQKFVRIWR